MANSKRKRKSVWTDFNENKTQVEDVVFEVSKLEDCKKQLTFESGGKKVDIKTIKSSNQYQKQHEVAVKMVRKYNGEHYQGAINLSTCRAILQDRVHQAKVELADRQSQEV